MASNAPTVGTLNATNFPAPSGTKVTTNLCLPGPEGCNPNGPAKSAYPVLLYESYTFWPLSYEDNRFSFAIVVTLGSDGKVLTTFEAPGSRYIDSIQVFSNNDTVNFVGQAFEAASVSWATLANQASVAGSHQSSASSQMTTLSTSTLTGSSSSSTSSSDSHSSSSSKSSLSGGAIAGITIGSVVGAIILVVSCLCLRKRAQKRPAPARPPPEPKPTLDEQAMRGRTPTPDMSPQQHADWMSTLRKVANQLEREGHQNHPKIQEGSQTAVNHAEAEDKSTPLVSIPAAGSQLFGQRSNTGSRSDSGQSTIPREGLGPPISDAGREREQNLLKN